MKRLIAIALALLLCVPAARCVRVSSAEAADVPPGSDYTWTITDPNLADFGSWSEADGYYYRGLSCYEEQDYENAASCYQAAAEMGHKEAQCALGMMYLFGIGVEKDTETARYYYKMAAEQEIAEAQAAVYTAFASMIDSQNSFGPDWQSVFVWSTMTVLGEEFIGMGAGGTSAYAAARVYMAETGQYAEDTAAGVTEPADDSISETAAGITYDIIAEWLYDTGQEPMPGPDGGEAYGANEQAAVELINRAVEWMMEHSYYQTRSMAAEEAGIGGDTSAETDASGQEETLFEQAALAMLVYDQGEDGLPLELRSGAVIYWPANVGAQYELGLLYCLDWFVEPDYEKAADCFAAIAERGHAGAQTCLSALYENGWGVEQNSQTAVAWLERAATAGYGWAMYDLGMLYYLGENVEQDYVQAVAWHEQAVEAGLAQSQYFLGLMYEMGTGVDTDTE